jgi:hypothetical protein
MTDNSVEDTELNEQWFEQHPVVSTVLWLIGGISKSPELSSPKCESGGKIPRTNSRLSWKDEHDGEIAEYISHDANRSEKKEKKRVSMMPRQTSLAHVGGTVHSMDSGDEHANLRSNSTEDDDEEEASRHEPASRGGEDMDENTMSPQWGWYVSTTPPQELYGKEKKNPHVHE